MAEQADSGDRPMGFWDHLMELRARLLRSLIAVGLGFVLAAIFSQYIIAFLRVPIEAFRATHSEAPPVFRAIPITAGFSAWISASLFGGLTLAMPYVLYQVWAFVRPGLKKRERGAVVPLVAGGTALFLSGAAVGYFYVAPAALNFFFAMNRMLGIEETSGLAEYLKMIIMLMVGFGLGFQLPLIMFVLSGLGVTGPGFYRARRKYAVVLAFVFGAFLTPPDVPSQLIMAGCLLALYELGILLSGLAERRRARREAEDQAKYAAEDAAADKPPPPDEPGPKE